MYQNNNINSKTKTTLLRILKHTTPYKWAAISALIGLAFVAMSEAAIPALLKPILDKGFTGQLKHSLWYVPAFLVGLVLIRGIFQFGSNYALSYITNSVLFDLRKQMFNRLLQAPASVYQNSSAASLINAIVFEVNSALQVITGIAMILIRDTLIVFGLIFYLLYLNWRLTLVVMIIFPVLGFMVTVINKRLRRLHKMHQNMTNELSYIVEETVGGYKVIKLHSGESYENNRFQIIANKLRLYSMKISVSGGLNQPLTQFVASVALSFILLVALFQTEHAQTTISGFIAFITAVILIISPLKHLADINQPLQRSIAAAEMIFKLVDQSIEEEHNQHIHSIKIEQSEGEIKFQNVCFIYNDLLKREILKDISLKITIGEIVAFVGPSGSGKSTLVNLLPRFFTPTSGKILIDNIDIQTMSLKDLRRQISFVSQDVVLFNDTILSNVAYGIESTQTVDRERVLQALYAANLSTLIKELPKGIDSEIGDNGNRLSGGQRQRIAIARAIYKDAPILILDEATSALDSESERQVQEALEALMKGKTTLVIAHRLSTIENANRIIVLDHGQIIEHGDHVELMRKNGVYANLYRLQFSQISS